MFESGGTSPALLLGALILVIALAVAIFVGILLYIVQGRAKTRAERASAHPLTPSHPKRAEPPPSGEGADESPEPPPVNLAALPGEVMRVVRNEQTGRIAVEVKGQRYEHIREIADAEIGRRVLWAIADLLRFTEGMAANPQAIRSAAQRAAKAEDKQPHAVASTTAQPGLPESQPPTTAPMLSQPDQSPSARYDMLAFFRRGLGPSTPGPSTAEQRSFVDEIEAILQDSIQQYTVPPPSEVHVRTGPEGQLQVEVGQEVYGSVDDIPDPIVQGLIRAAVAEWETR